MENYKQDRKEENKSLWVKSLGAVSWLNLCWYCFCCSNFPRYLSLPGGVIGVLETDVYVACKVSVISLRDGFLGQEDRLSALSCVHGAGYHQRGYKMSKEPILEFQGQLSGQKKRRVTSI